MEFFTKLFGSAEKGIELGSIPISLVRGILVFIIIFLMFRLGPRRIFSNNFPMDYILIVLLAATFGASVNPQSSFISMLPTAIMFFGLYWLLTLLAHKFNSLSKIVKGSGTYLIKDGEINWKNM